LGLLLNRQKPVQLTQEFRWFDFLSPWESAIDYVLPGDEKAKGSPQRRTPQD
jgi:NADH-quinone oxidoreductase subunit C